MYSAALGGAFRGLFVQGEDLAQSDPNTEHVVAALEAMELVVVQDLFLNETARYAHVFLPGTSFLEKDGTFTNAERRINRVRPVMAPATGKHEWQTVCEIATADGIAHGLGRCRHDHGRDRRGHPAVRRACRSRSSTSSAACSGPATTTRPRGRRSCTSTRSCRGRADSSRRRSCRPTSAPLAATRCSSRPGGSCSQYNVGAQTRRTANVEWHGEDVLDLHPADAEERGIHDGDRVSLAEPRR